MGPLKIIKFIYQGNLNFDKCLINAKLKGRKQQIQIAVAGGYLD